jgi:integrase
MRRWARLGISNHSVIEFMGKRVHRIHDGWETVVERAGLATEDKARKVLRHTLRHTAITWYLSPDRRTGRKVDIETVSLYCGVSVETIRKTYRARDAGHLHRTAGSVEIAGNWYGIWYGSAVQTRKQLTQHRKSSSPPLPAGKGRLRPHLRGLASV